ncbi:MAG: ChaN family lipoprotein [Polyangiaceae bacterium]|nr:ChaN family lipoprotein [Polyangiaceae bacterium]
MYRRFSGLLCSAFFFAACGGSQVQLQQPVGSSPVVELSAPPEEKDEKKAVPADVVEKSARPYSGYRLADEKVFSVDEVMSRIASADAVCVGELHDDPLSHYAQLEVARALLARREMRGIELGIALEMVRQDEQSALNAFDAGSIGVDQVAEATDWEKEWGYPFVYWQPFFELAKKSKIPLVALGVRRSLTKQIATNGIQKVPREMGNLVPTQLDFENERHRSNFAALMGGHPHSAPQATPTDGDQNSESDHSTPHGHSKRPDLSNYYEAQVLWDEAMAKRATTWLEAHAPARKLIILAGQAHCAYSAIPERIEKRGKFTVVSVLPVRGGSPLEALDAPLPPEGLFSQLDELLEAESAGKGQEPADADEPAAPEAGTNEKIDPNHLLNYLAADYDYQLVFDE